METNNKLNDIFDTMNEIYEFAQNDLLILTNLELFDGVKKEDWKKYQLSGYHLDQVNKMLKSHGEKLLSGINKATIKAAEIAGVPNAKFTKMNKDAVGILIKTANKDYKSSVNKVWSLKDKTTPLYNKILEQARQGLDFGLKVKTKNGRHYEFKSYMEMSVRTAINNEITKQQLELNKETQNIFMLCNEFQDAANDHAPYQGKIYFDDRYKSFGLPDELEEKVTNFIRDKKLKSMQWVVGKPVWLTTRPNCRHKLLPITIKQAMGDINVVKRDMKTVQGNYKNDKKYEQTQALRYCERNVRKYKSQLNQAILIDQKIPSLEIKRLIKHYKELTRKWQQNANIVVRNANKNGKWLDRDYERETRTKIVQDLGFKYFGKAKTNNPTPPDKTNKTKQKVKEDKKFIYKYQDERNKMMNLALDVNLNESIDDYYKKSHPIYLKLYNKKIAIDEEIDHIDLEFRRIMNDDFPDQEKIGQLLKQKQIKSIEYQKASKQLNNFVFAREYKLSEAFTKSKADANNFFKNSIGVWEESKVPRGKSKTPDYKSYNRRTGKISSEYWYTDEGVYRRSDHWGVGVASCDWALMTEEKVIGTGDLAKHLDKKVGFIRWEDLKAKRIINRHDKIFDEYPDQDNVFEFKKPFTI